MTHGQSMWVKWYCTITSLDNSLKLRWRISIQWFQICIQAKSRYASNGQPWVSPYGWNGQMTMILQNYKLRKFHRTFDRKNPSSCFRDVFGPCETLYGSNGQITIMLHTYMSRQFQRTSIDGSPSSSLKVMYSTMCGPTGTIFDRCLVHGQAHMGKWASDHCIVKVWV